MVKTVVIVMDSVNLTAQAPPYFKKSTHNIVGIASNSFSVQSIVSLGTPSEVPLIQFYLASGTPSHYQIIKDLNALGYIIAFTLTPNTSSTATSYCYNLGLSNSVETWHMSHPISFYTLENTVLNNTLATHYGTSVTYKPSGNNFGTSIPANIAHPSFVKIAQVSASDNSIYFGYIPAGTTLLNGFILKVPIIFNGFIYTSNTMEPIINSIIQDIYDFCDLNIKPPYVIKGKVQNTSGLPLIRDVFLYRQNNGTLIGTKKSLEDGTFSIGVLNEEPVFAVCKTNDLNKRNQIIGPLIPVLSEE